MQEYQESLVLPQPSTKELNYISKLESEGFKNVDLSIPIIGVVGYGRSSYSIKMDCPFSLTTNNKDSIELLNKKIANELFSVIIEDSIKRDLYQVTVVFRIKNTIIKSENLYQYRKVYLKNDLTAY